jgi:hypothetical protein
MEAGKEASGAPKLLHYLERVEAVDSPFGVLRVVQSYLNAWSATGIKSVQRVDGGWAPFDRDQRPLRVDGLPNLRHNRDMIHRQCKALREAGMALTPEFAELDEFFLAAAEKSESLGRAASKVQASVRFAPAIASH